MININWKTIKGTARELDRGEYWAPIGFNTLGGYLLSHLIAIVTANSGHDEMAKGLLVGGVLLSTANFFSEGIRTAYQIYSSKQKSQDNLERRVEISLLEQNQTKP